jgi:hypothetical protein
MFFLDYTLGGYGTTVEAAQIRLPEKQQPYEQTRTRTSKYWKLFLVLR